MHHLLLAATISAALVRLHSTILDKALDLVTHYVILGLLDPAERPGSPPGEYPTVLILMPAVVSDERLAGLVRTVTATWRRPAEPHLRRVLVFAMDLAPLPQEKHKAELIWQKDLDDALDRAVQDGIRVVLEKPFFQEKPGARDVVRLAWLLKRCDAGIHFGVPGAQDQTRPVHSVTTNVPSVGVMAPGFAASRCPEEAASASVTPPVMRREMSAATSSRRDRGPTPRMPRRSTRSA